MSRYIEDLRLLSIKAYLKRRYLSIAATTAHPQCVEVEPLK